MQIGVCAVGAPISADLQANLVIVGKGNLLTANIVLPVGSIGPTYSTALALPGAFATGTLVQGVIITAGGASQVTIALSLRGKAA